MPENVVWNKKLLIVSLVVALLAVILFYVYDSFQRRKLTGDTVEVLTWKRDLTPGQEVSRGDFGVTKVRRELLRDIQGLMTNTTNDLELVKEARVSRYVQKGDFIRSADVMANWRRSPSRNIKKGMVGVTLQVDPHRTPGRMLSVDDRVDVIGLVSIKGKTARAYTLIENLRVLAIGGRPGESVQRAGGAEQSRTRDPGRVVYRSITVEVIPDVAVQLADLMARVQGKIWLFVRNPTDRRMKYPHRKTKDHGAINPEVLPVLSQPLPDSR